MLAFRFLIILWSLFFTANTARIFKAETDEATVAHWRLSTIKCQHRVADTVYPPDFEQREKRVTKHVLTTGRYQVVTAWNKEQRVKICSHSWWVSIVVFNNYYILYVTVIDMLHFNGTFVLLIQYVANYWVRHHQVGTGTAPLLTQCGGCVGWERYVNMFQAPRIFRLPILHRLQLDLLYEMVKQLEKKWLMST